MATTKLIGKNYTTPDLIAKVTAAPSTRKTIALKGCCSRGCC